MRAHTKQPEGHAEKNSPGGSASLAGVIPRNYRTLMPQKRSARIRWLEGWFAGVKEGLRNRVSGVATELDASSETLSWEAYVHGFNSGKMFMLFAMRRLAEDKPKESQIVRNSLQEDGMSEIQEEAREWASEVVKKIFDDEPGPVKIVVPKFGGSFHQTLRHEENQDGNGDYPRTGKGTGVDLDDSDSN